MIRTNIKKLDQFLSGSIKNGIIVDIFGSSGTGKTQLAMQISISALQNGGQVLFQDTTGGFRPERMMEMMNARNIKLDLLDKVSVGRLTNTSEQIQYLKKIKNNSDFSLIVIDNITDLFSYEYTSEKQFLEKNLLFMRYMHELSLIGIELKIPIIITNMIRRIDNYEFENLNKAINMYTHLKIKLSKKQNSFSGEIISPFLKENFSYLIKSEGLVDSS